MAEPPTISVITPSFQSANTIAQTIESVLAQGYKNWEHIVVDGGSKDGTIELLKRYPHLIWTSEKDEGHFHAMNKGVARASGQILVILNADDCFRPGALAHVADAFQKNPSWDALFGDAVYVDGHGNKIYQRQEAIYDFHVLLYALDYICHQALFVRKEVYEKIGGYRHKDFSKATDFEFKLRLGRAGCTVGHIPHFLVNFRYHMEGRSSDLEFVRQSMDEAARIRREYGNPGGLTGRCLSVVYKAKRQIQKLTLRHTCDLVPATWKLRSHMRGNAKA